VKDYDYIFPDLFINEQTHVHRMQHQYPHIPLFAFLSFASSLFPVAAGWIRWNSNSKEMKLFLGLFDFYIPVLLVALFLVGQGLNGGYDRTIPS
jgi:hypothetical protein